MGERGRGSHSTLNRALGAKQPPFHGGGRKDKHCHPVRAVRRAEMKFLISGYARAHTLPVPVAGLIGNRSFDGRVHGGSGSQAGSGLGRGPRAVGRWAARNPRGEPLPRGRRAARARGRVWDPNIKYWSLVSRRARQCGGSRVCETARSRQSRNASNASSDTDRHPDQSGRGGAPRAGEDCGQKRVVAGQAAARGSPPAQHAQRRTACITDTTDSGKAQPGGEGWEGGDEI